MSVNLTINGQTFAYPETADTDWGSSATLWATAATNGMLQKAGGAFTLLADVNFGATFGLTSAYYKSRTADISTAGSLRLAQADSIGWRNLANSADLLLSVSTDALRFNGVALTLAGAIVNADISASAAIAFSKLAALTSGNVLVGSAGNVATSLSLTGDVVVSNAGVTSISSNVIVNADVNASAGIAYSKLDLVGGVVNADVNASAAIAFSKLAVLTSGNVLVGSAGNVATQVALTGDVTISNAGVTAIASGVIVNADVNASAAIAGSKLAPQFGAQLLSNDREWDTLQIATPASPAASRNKLYFKSDGRIYRLNSAGVETDVATATVTPASARLLSASGTNPSTSSTTAVDITGFTLDITTNATSRIAFTFSSSFRNTATPNATQINIQVNGVNQFGTGGLYNAQDVSGHFYPINLSGMSDSLAAGTYTVKVRAQVSAGTLTFLNDAAQSTMITCLQVNT